MTKMPFLKSRHPGLRKTPEKPNFWKIDLKKGSGARLRKGKGFNAPLSPDRSVGLLKHFVKTNDSQKLTTVQPDKQLYITCNNNIILQACI